MIVKLVTPPPITPPEKEITVILTPAEAAQLLTGFALLRREYGAGIWAPLYTQIAALLYPVDDGDGD